MPTGIFFENDEFIIQGWWSTGSHFEVLDKNSREIIHTGYCNHNIDNSLDACYYRLIEEAKNKNK